MELHPPAGLSLDPAIPSAALRPPESGAPEASSGYGSMPRDEVFAADAGVTPLRNEYGLDGIDLSADGRGAGERLAPPLARRPMAPAEPDAGWIPARRRRHWLRSAVLRRCALGLLVTLQTAFCTDYMAHILPYQGTQPLEIAILAFFAILCAWVAVGFWTALSGFGLLVSGHDRHAITARVPLETPLAPAARCAVIMPICNEDVTRVFAGLRATYDSVARTDALANFDFFVLSDSNDPDTRVAELDAWASLCRDANAFSRVFYRWRRHRIKRKSGNVADFCRRWGADYRYMVVLDADSVMSGDCLKRLVQLMEANPGSGIIQTPPRAAGRETLYARIQQFAGRVYGPVFTAGLHFWQLGEAHYWGHNAIIRVAPFMQYCALERLPGTGALSGEILSHDFVEAALMRRAGWAVWIAYDLDGSYEEMPPNLIDELKRDRRWCHGNLMNFRFLFARGLHPAHRAVFVTGAAAYVSALLWFAFLLLATAQLFQHSLVEPDYFSEPFQLFPVWPEWHPKRAIGLFLLTAVFLFLPKILGALYVALHGVRRFGGSLRLMASLLGEMLFSMLLAPVRMLFHSQFVSASLIGHKVVWKSPPRDDSQTPWSEAIRRHGWHSLIGLGWAAAVYWVNPGFIGWLLPVAGALMLSIPVSVFSSRVTAGRKALAKRLFLIPEEDSPPRELRELQANLKASREEPDFVDALCDPAVNALLRAAFPQRPQSERAQAYREGLVKKLLDEGARALSRDEAMRLIDDPDGLARVHEALIGAGAAHPRRSAPLTGGRVFA